MFVAELGDKTMLASLALASRYPRWRVLVGIALGAAAIQVVSVSLGSALGSVLEGDVVSVVAGVLFLVFAAWTLFDRDDDEEEGAEAAAGPRASSVVLGIAGAFAVAEFGDKTMLATFALAARNGAVATWLGATAGLVAANALAVVVGAGLTERLGADRVRYLAAALFAVFGVALLVEAVL